MFKLSKTLLLVAWTIVYMVYGVKNAHAQTNPSDKKRGAGVPNYSVPYVLQTYSSIKSVVDKIQKRVTQHSAFYLVDSETHQVINDLSVFNKKAGLQEGTATFEEWSYPNGVSLTACNDLFTITGDTSYLNYAVRFYDFIFKVMPYFRAMKQKGVINRHPYEKMVNMQALDHCGSITTALIRIEKLHPDVRFRAWIDTVDNYISNKQYRLKDGTIARQRPQPESLWADDFYMCIPFFAQMGLLTGNKKYWDDAVLQIIQLSERLFDIPTGLFDHGWNVNSSEYDPRVYWGRANGWCTMAIVELLSVLPENYPGRDKVLQIYRMHVQAITKLQDGTGLWHNIIDRNETFLETSASAMFVYSIAKGINEGLISHVYGPIALTGWNAIATKVKDSGEVCDIAEGTTFAADNVYYFNRGTSCTTTFYGAVMLAGAEILKLIGNPKFEITAPIPNSVNSALQFRLKADKTPR